MKLRLHARAALTLAFVLTLGVAPFKTVRAGDFNPQPDPPGIFGMFGLVAGQTARLNVAAVDIEQRRLPPDPYTPGPWRVELSFYNGDGTLLAQRFDTLELGKAVELSFAAPRLP